MTFFRLEFFEGVVRFVKRKGKDFHKAFEVGISADVNRYICF